MTTYSRNELKTHIGPAIGFDLGTTFCSLAIIRHGKVDKSEIIPNDMGKNKTPSYISFPGLTCNNEDDDEDEDDTEEDDNEPFFGETAKMLAHENPRGTIFDVKRMLGRTFNDPRLQHDMQLWPFDILENEGQLKIKTGPTTFHSPVEITTLLLTHLKELAENYLGTEVSKAVVAVPAYFNPIQRQMTKEACTLAGFNVLQLINEPTAAAVAYKIHKKDLSDLKTRNCLIFDFGGGTFDAAALTIIDNKIHVKATGGDAHLGGEDIDNNMVNYCIQEFKKNHGVDLLEGKNSSDPEIAVKTSKRLRRLKLECEKQKMFLSQTQKQVISLDAIHRDTPLVVLMTRKIFDSINMDLFKKCILVVEQVLKDSKMDRSDIEDIVLVGGSSRIPKVQEMLSEFFGGKQLCRSIDADEAVAVGASMLAFHGENVEVVNVHIQDQLEAEVPKLQWTTVTPNGLQRYSHSTVVVEGTIYSFGGYTTGGNYPSGGKTDPIDIHILSTSQSSMRWELLSVKTNDQTPSQRNGHKAVAHGHYVYLWGGMSYMDYCNTLYCFDTKTLKWETPKVSGTVPEARTGHSVVVIGNKMCTFGGFKKTGRYSNDIHVLDLETYSWSRIITKGPAPLFRDIHSAVVYKNRYMLIFGGMVHNQDFEFSLISSNNLISFDFETRTWSYPKTNGKLPHGRDSHAAFIHNGFMYIVAGYSWDKKLHFNDIYRYNPETFNWQEIIVESEGLTPRQDMGCVVQNNQAFIFGGFSKQSSDTNLSDISNFLATKEITHYDTLALNMS